MILLQYFNLKYGFRPILGEWQLGKLDLIFKREELKISAANIILPNFLDIKWETVGCQFETWAIFIFYLKLTKTSMLVEATVCMNLSMILSRTLKDICTIDS